MNKKISGAYSNIKFPVIFYDIAFEFPPYKILNNEKVSFCIALEIKDLLHTFEEHPELEHFVRLIDASGTEYRLEYIDHLKISVPRGDTKSFSLEDILGLMSSNIQKMQNRIGASNLTFKSIESLYLKLYDAQENI